jgi:hypothetical protein
MRGKGARNTTMSGDTRVDWSEAFELVPSLAVGYIWHAGVHAAEVAQGLERIGFEIVAQVISRSCGRPRRRAGSRCETPLASLSTPTI